MSSPIKEHRAGLATPLRCHRLQCLLGFLVLTNTMYPLVKGPEGEGAREVFKLEIPNISCSVFYARGITASSTVVSALLPQVFLTSQPVPTVTFL